MCIIFVVTLLYYLYAATVFRFNTEKYDWNSNDLLEAFSEVDHKDICLAHLFTYIDFDKGVLGLAYVGSDKTSDVGGICTDPYSRG